MSKYNAGDMVRIIGIGKVWGNDFKGGISTIPLQAQAMVGQVCEIEEVFEDGDISIFTQDKSDTWTFHEDELETETIIKPKPRIRQSKGKDVESNPSEAQSSQQSEGESSESQSESETVEAELMTEEPYENEDNDPYGGGGPSQESEQEQDENDEDSSSQGGGGGDPTYLVSADPDLKTLISMVNSLMQQGFEVVGPIVIARHLKEKRNWFYQTLVKK